MHLKMPSAKWRLLCLGLNVLTSLIRKSKDYVYGIWVYKVLCIWQIYYRVKQIISFMHETVNRGKK